MARPSFVRLLGLATPLLLAGACGGSSSGGGGSSISLNDLIPKIADAVCTTAQNCLGPLFTTLINSSDCKTRFTTSIHEGSFSLIQGGVDAGTVKYDPTKAQSCLDAISASGCGFFGARLSLLCSAAMSGTKPAGTACTFNEECSTGLFCKMDQCPGACTSLLAAGAACTGDDECGAGLSCDGSTKKCKTAVSIQVTGVEGSTCDPTAAQFCQTGLVCALTSFNPARFTCEKPATGTTCHLAIPEGCPEGQYCKLGAGSITGSCTPMPAIGSACANHTPNDTNPACPTDSICSLGTCKAYVALGSPCAADDECYSKACVSGVCKATKCTP